MATNRVKLEDIINQAKTGLEAGNPDRAVALCHHIFKYYPRCLEVSRVLGEAYTEKRLLDEADQLFVFVLSADPQDVLGYVDRGFIAYERGQANDAIMYYERALELDPSIEQLREELLRLYREQQGASRRAKIRLTKVGLANARMRDGFYGQAIEEYAGVLRETPNRLDVQVGLMEAYWRNRDYPRAEKLATGLLSNHPNLVKANLILWHIYGVRRNQDRAAAFLDKAHALDPLNLLAERLFEDAMVSSDAMRYISMLGVPAVPAMDDSGPARSVGDSGPLLPDWVNAPDDTDIQLGLRADVPSPLADTPSNLGLDVFALLADTEKHVAEQQAGAKDQEAALAELDELRNSASVDEQDNLFDLFEEVETKPASSMAKAAPLAAGGAIAAGTIGAAAFDLDFDFDPASGKSTDLSQFEEIEPPDLSEAGIAGGMAAEPFRLDDVATAKGDDFDPPVFDLFSDDNQEDYPTIPVTPFQASTASAPPAGEDDEDLFATEPVFNPAQSAEPLVPFDLFGDESSGPKAEANSGGFNRFEADSPAPQAHEPLAAFDFFEDDTSPAFDPNAVEAPATFDFYPEADEASAAAELASNADNNDFMMNYQPEPEKETNWAEESKEDNNWAEASQAASQPEIEQAEEQAAPPWQAEARAADFAEGRDEAAEEPAFAKDQNEAAEEIVEDKAEEKSEETADDNSEEKMGFGEKVVALGAAGVAAAGAAIGSLFHKKKDDASDEDEAHNEEGPKENDQPPEFEVAQEVAELQTGGLGSNSLERENNLDNKSNENNEDDNDLNAGSNHHAFHRRNEQGPIPDFVLATMSATPELNLNETNDQSADSSALAEALPISGSPAEALDLSEPAYDFSPGSAPQQSQSYQMQENDAMPIKRGPEDDSNVFDWEREELPDYLQAFAMDEDEVANAGLSAFNPTVNDVNTSPARIRPRDDTGGVPGDLPDWLNPAAGGAEGGKPVRGEQFNLGGAIPGSGSGTLPNWLNETELDAQMGGNAPTMPGRNDPNLGLQPFSLIDDGFGGPPPPANPPMGRPATPPPGPPPGMDPAFGDMSDLAPFSFGDDGGMPATPPPPNRGGFDAPTAPPPRQSPPSSFGGFDAPSAPPSRPSAPPSGGFGMPGMDDLAPFSFDDNGGGAMAAPPPAPPRPAAPPPAPATPPAPSGGFGMPGMDDLMPFSFDDNGSGAPPPPAQAAPPPRPASPPPASTPPPPRTGTSPFLPDDDMSDLAPFSFDDNSGGATAAPPPPRPAAPPPAAPPPAFPPPRSPFDPGADLSGFEETDLGSLKPFSFGDNAPASPPPAAPRPPAPSPFGGGGTSSPNGGQPGPNLGFPGGDDLGLEPFALEGDMNSLFGGNTPDPRNRGNRGLGFGDGAINPLDTLNEQPFNPGKRNRSTDAESEFEPTQDGPLRKYGWMQEQERRKKERETQDVSGNNSMFDRLKQRREQQDMSKAQAAPPPQEVQPTPLAGFEDIASFQEIELRSTKPQTDRLGAGRVDMQADAFDLSDLGLNQDLSDEAFTQGLDETLPTSPQVVQDFAPVAPPSGTQDFDFTPFDLDGLASEPATLAPEPVQSQPEADLNLPDFDFGEPEAQVEATPPQPFSGFDLSSEEDGAEAVPSFNFEPEPAKAVPPVVNDDLDFFNLGSPKQEEEKPDTNLASLPTAQPPQGFDFGSSSQAGFEAFTEPAPVQPFFEPPAQPVAPPPVAQTPIAPPPVAQTPIAPPPVAKAPVVAPSVAPRVAPAGADLETSLQMASSFVEQRDDNQAMTYFNSAIRVADSGSLDGIAARLSQILGQPGANPRYHRLLGDVYKKQGQFQAALAEYSKALKPAVGAKK